MTKLPLRILALLENNPYPYDVTVRTHAETLAESGYKVTVMCPRGRGQSWQETINGVRIYRFPLLGVGTGAINYAFEFLYATLIMALLTLWIWIRHGLDVIHIYNPPDTLFTAALLAKLAGKTIFWDIRDLSPELYQSKYERCNGLVYNLLVKLERASCRIADRVVVVNESYRRLIIDRHGLPADRVSVVRLGPEMGQVRLVPPDPGLRARAGIVIAYLGKMAKQDGVDHLLWALHHLSKNFGHQDWFCVLIGKADNPEELAKLALELGIDGRTWFTGFIPDDQMLSYLSTADICVAPDPANPLNNISTMTKLMEYMALGKPSVAYGLCEHRVTAGDAALYAEANNQMDLARQIARLVESPNLRAQLGTIGRKRIEEQLAWDHQKEHLLTLYRGLAPIDTARKPGDAGGTTNQGELR